MIAATIAAGFSGKKEGIEKHVLKWGKDARPDWKEVEAKMMAWALKHNAELKRKRGG